MTWKPEYPDWLTQAIVSAYKAGETAERIAEVINYPVASVRWKLTREGVYISKQSRKRVIEESEASF